MQGGSLAAFLENRVDEALKALIAEQGGFDHTAEKLAREANRLLRITKEFEGGIWPGGVVSGAGGGDADDRG